MKCPSRKQVIIPMSKVNINNILASENEHIVNINRALKNIKSNITVNFICLENLGITIVSNSIASQSDLEVMERYVKSIENVKLDNVQILRLPQSKLYLKIIGILYFMKDTDTPIRSDNIKAIIKANHIFNNLILISKPRVIKAFSKSDIVIILIGV